MIILHENSPGVLPDEHHLKLLQAVLNKYCLSLTRSTWEAEDLAQDTWIKALGTLTSGNTNPEALLLRIAKNTWIDGTRRKAVFYRVQQRIQQKDAGPSDSSLFEIENSFQALIKHLSPLQRTVFLMRDVLGYSSIETAKHLGTTDGAIKAALFRARQAMPSIREEFWTEDGPALSEDAGFRAFLSEIALSFEKGQLATLLELIRQEDVSGTKGLLEQIRTQPELRMAA